MENQRKTILFQGDSITDGNWGRNHGSIVRQLAEEYHTLFVPLQEVFNQAAQNVTAEYWLWDGVHPTAAGHQLLAREWLKTVQQSDLCIR